MNKEAVHSILEGDVVSERNPLQVAIQEQITQMYNEGAFTRTVATIAAAIGAGWGAAKLTGAWIANFGVPGPIANVFSGITMSTAGAFEWLGVFSTLEASGMSGLSIMGDIIFQGTASGSMLAAGSLFYLPVALTALGSVVGGTIMVVAMRKLFQANPTVKQQHKALNQAVNERDKVLQKLKKMKQVIGDDGEADSQFQAAIKEADRASKKIMKEADKLERAVMKNINQLNDDEVETITSYIEVAKNGMLTNVQKGGA